MNFSEELSFNQKIITEVHPFEAPVLTRFKLKSVKILGLAAEYYILSKLISFIKEKSIYSTIRSKRQNRLRGN